MKRSNLIREALTVFFLLSILTFGLTALFRDIQPAHPLAPRATNLSAETSIPYPPPEKTKVTPQPTITETLTIPGYPVTITPVPITPFPTLTLVPGPTSTSIATLGPELDAAGTILFVAEEEKGDRSTLYDLAVDEAGKTEKPRERVSEDDLHSEGFIFPSPNQQYLAITGAWGNLRIFNIDQRRLETIPYSLGPEGVFFNWFPDDHHILWGGSALILADPFSGEHSVLVVPGYGGITGAAPSPDGRFIVYALHSTIPQESGLWMIEATGQNRRLILPGVFATNLAWSPDGTKIAFFGSGWQVMDANGSHLQELAQGIILPQCYFLPPLWSPDSSTIAVVTSESGDAFCQGWVEDVFKGTNIVLIDVERGSFRPLFSESGGGSMDPGWSPDGKQIVFASNRSGTPAIWVVNKDGSNPRQLTNQDQFVRFPIWQRQRK